MSWFRWCGLRDLKNMFRDMAKVKSLLISKEKGCEFWFTAFGNLIADLVIRRLWRQPLRLCGHALLLYAGRWPHGFSVVFRVFYPVYLCVVPSIFPFTLSINLTQKTRFDSK
jgi:hypothetical protein